MLPLTTRVSWEGPFPSLSLSASPSKPHRKPFSQAQGWGGAVSPGPHGDPLPGLGLVWVFLIEVWDPSGCG